jgi:hypothetical protein
MELVLYDQMRVAISQCAAVDEAAGIKDQATRLEAYARVRDDAEAQRQFAEIRLRACIRIGEISRDLPKGKPGPKRGSSKLNDTDVAQFDKEDVLQRSGIQIRTAERYEELAGPKEEQAEAIIGAATDAYFAEQQQNRKPVSFQGLRGAVRDALEITFGKPINRHKKQEAQEPDLLVHFLYSPRWALEKQNFNPKELATKVIEEFAADEIQASDLFINLLTKFAEHLKERFPQCP